MEVGGDPVKRLTARLTARLVRAVPRVRLLTVYGVGAAFVVVPVHRAASTSPQALAEPAAAVVIGAAGPRFMLDRDGRVVRVAADGTPELTASMGPYVTPFGAVVGDRIVFGGIRCEETDCDQQVAEVTVLDPDGHVVERLALRRASDQAEPRLDGLALAGVDGGTLWVAGGESLFRVTVSPPRVTATIPWTGGEPCVVDHVLYDLVASGGTYFTQGARLPSGARYTLQLRRWTGRHWQLVDGAARTMPDGQNAYCASTGYELRDGSRRLARWTPAARGWRPAGLGPEGSGTPNEADSADAGAVEAVLASGEAEALRVHQYNLCSAACGNAVREHTRDLVVRLVDRDRPAAVSLNEVCYDDRVQLADRLPGYTAGASYTALDDAAGCPGAVKQFGNLVLLRSDLQLRGASWAQFSSQATAPCGRGSLECRGVVCAEAAQGPAGAEPSLVFCSAHLESPRRGPTVAARQVGEYLHLVDRRYGDDSVHVLAGDLNLARPDADQHFVAHGYRTAAVPSTIVDRPGSRQIDMIYYDGPGRSVPTGDTHCDRRASDHCYLVTSWAGAELA